MQTTCYGLTLGLVEMLSQLKVQNMTTEITNDLNLHQLKHIDTLITAKDFYKTRCEPTDIPTLEFKAAITAKKDEEFLLNSGKLTKIVHLFLSVCLTSTQSTSFLLLIL